MAKKRILFVDDDPIVLDTYYRLLREAGYEVVTAKTVKDAKKLISKSNFDLLMTDYLYDHEFISFLNTSLKQLPVILWSGVTLEEVPKIPGLRRAIKGGPFDNVLENIAAAIKEYEVFKPFKKIRVLLVDNDPGEIISEVFKVGFSDRIEIVFEKDPKKAKQLFKDNEFDVVVSDILFDRDFKFNNNALELLQLATSKGKLAFIHSAVDSIKFPKVIPGLIFVDKMSGPSYLARKIIEKYNEKNNSEQKKIKLLYVDDNLLGTHKDVVKENLERSGPFEVVCIDNHSDAIKLLDKNKFDMVVSDILVGDEDIALRFYKKAIQMNIPITLHSSADYHDIFELRRLVEKYDIGFFQKNGEPDDLAKYLLESLEEHNKKGLQKQELREEELRELQKLLKPISHVETGKGTPEELRALVLEARELDAQLRNHVSGNIEMPRRELEIKFAKLQEIKSKIREYVRNRTIQRQTVLKDGTTYRDRYWKGLSKTKRTQENLQDTPLSNRLTLARQTPIKRVIKSKPRIK